MKKEVGVTSVGFCPASDMTAEMEYLNCYEIHPLMQSEVYHLIEYLKPKGLKELIIFGSATSERCDEESDLDIYVEGCNYSDVDSYWTRRHVPLDIFMPESVQPTSILGRQIFKYGVSVYKKFVASSVMEPLRLARMLLTSTSDNGDYDLVAAGKWIGLSIEQAFKDILGAYDFNMIGMRHNIESYLCAVKGVAPGAFSSVTCTEVQALSENLRVWIASCEKPISKVRVPSRDELELAYNVAEKVCNEYGAYLEAKGLT